jgi:hypothetical protein
MLNKNMSSQSKDLKKNQEIKMNNNNSMSMNSRRDSVNSRNDKEEIDTDLNENIWTFNNLKIEEDVH